MKQLYTALFATVAIAAGIQRSEALTVDELGAGAAEIVMVNISGIGTIPVDAGVLKLDVGGLQGGAVRHGHAPIIVRRGAPVGRWPSCP